MEKYLPKFPVEARNHAKHPQYTLRCWAADYDNIFKAAIMSMVGVMGKIPAKVEFGNVEQSVRDFDVWGNEDDDRLVGLKARLNHAQTLFGRYGLWLDVLTDSKGLYPQLIIKEYTCYQIMDGDTYISPIDGKRRLHPNCRRVLIPYMDIGDRGTRPAEAENFDLLAKEMYHANPNAKKKYSELSYEYRRKLRYDAMREYQDKTGKAPYKQVSGNMTFADYLKGQSNKFQREWLGETRYQFYKSGKLTLDQIVSPDRGFKRTIEELGMIIR